MMVQVLVTGFTQSESQAVLTHALPRQKNTRQLFFRKSHVSILVGTLAGRVCVGTIPMRTPLFMHPVVVA